MCAVAEVRRTQMQDPHRELMRVDPEKFPPPKEVGPMDKSDHGMMVAKILKGSSLSEEDQKMVAAGWNQADSIARRKLMITFAQISRQAKSTSNNEDEAARMSRDASSQFLGAVVGQLKKSGVLTDGFVDEAAKQAAAAGPKILTIDPIVTGGTQKPVGAAETGGQQGPEWSSEAHGELVGEIVQGSDLSDMHKSLLREGWNAADKATKRKLMRVMVDVIKGAKDEGGQSPEAARARSTRAAQTMIDQLKKLNDDQQARNLQVAGPEGAARLETQTLNQTLSTFADVWVDRQQENAQRMGVDVTDRRAMRGVSIHMAESEAEMGLVAGVTQVHLETGRPAANIKKAIMATTGILAVASMAFLEAKADKEKDEKKKEAEARERGEITRPDGTKTTQADEALAVAVAINMGRTREDKDKSEFEETVQERLDRMWKAEHETGRFEFRQDFSVPLQEGFNIEESVKQSAAFKELLKTEALEGTEHFIVSQAQAYYLAAQVATTQGVDMIGAQEKMELGLREKERAA